MSTHTPGPWRVVRTSAGDDVGGEFVIVSDDAGDGPGGRNLVFGGTEYTILTEADATLAASAPDLLEALIAVEKWWLEEGKNAFIGAPYAIFAARAAIAKARGEKT